MGAHKPHSPFLTIDFKEPYYILAIDRSVFLHRKIIWFNFGIDQLRFYDLLVFVLELYIHGYP